MMEIYFPQFINYQILNIFIYQEIKLFLYVKFILLK